MHDALQMPPATRVYVLLLMLITAVDVSVGKVIDSGNTFSLDWGRTVKVSWSCVSGHRRFWLHFSKTKKVSNTAFLGHILNRRISSSSGV